MNSWIGRAPALARGSREPQLAASPALYAWYLHAGMLDALFDETSRNRLRRATHRLIGRGDHIAYTRELEGWMRRHPVDPLDVALVTGRCRVGRLVWAELDFLWSDVSAERRMTAAGAVDVRCAFDGRLAVDGGSQLRVHGTFNPARITCSTASTELRGTRRQFVLGQVAQIGDGPERYVELRPLAIATRFLDQEGEWPEPWGTRHDWQRIDPGQVEQFAQADVDRADPTALDVMATIPETLIKQGLAHVLGEPTTPNDWGGEQADLWTAHLRVHGRAHTAAFLLKGPAKFSPMTIAMLGKNGDQLERLGRTAAEVLVVQHCHTIRPEVVSMLRSIASDFRHVRRYMLLDGYATYAILSAAGVLPSARTGRQA